MPRKKRFSPRASSQVPYRLASVLRHESSLTPLLVLYKFKADALNLRGERKERIGSFPGSFGNRGSVLERVSFDDASVSRKRVRAAGCFPF